MTFTLSEVDGHSDHGIGNFGPSVFLNHKSALFKNHGDELVDADLSAVIEGQGKILVVNRGPVKGLGLSLNETVTVKDVFKRILDRGMRQRLLAKEIAKIIEGNVWLEASLRGKR